MRGGSLIFCWHILREILLAFFNHCHLIIARIELESIDALGSYARFKKKINRKLHHCQQGKKWWFHSHVRQAVPSGRKLGHIIIAIPHREYPT